MICFRLFESLSRVDSLMDETLSVSFMHFLERGCPAE